MAKSLLKSKNYLIEETDRALVSDFKYKTVPQIWIENNHIGGYAELAEMFGKGESQYEGCVACEG